MDDQKLQQILRGGSLGSVAAGVGYAGSSVVLQGTVDWGLVWMFFFLTALPWAVYVYLGGVGYID